MPLRWTVNAVAPCIAKQPRRLHGKSGGVEPRLKCVDTTCIGVANLVRRVTASKSEDAAGIGDGSRRAASLFADAGW